MEERIKIISADVVDEKMVKEMIKEKKKNQIEKIIKEFKHFIKKETYLLGNLEREEITFDEFWELRKKIIGSEE